MYVVLHYYIYGNMIYVILYNKSKISNYQFAVCCLS